MRTIFSDITNLDFTEFIVAISTFSKGEPSDRLEWMFDAFDLNSNGYIEYDELKKLIKVFVLN